MQGYRSSLETLLLIHFSGTQKIVTIELTLTHALLYLEQINEQKVRKRDHLAILLIKGEIEKQRQKEKKQGGEPRREEKETHSKCDTCITMLLIVVVVSVFIVVLLPLVTFLRWIKNMRINFYNTLNNTFLVHQNSRGMCLSKLFFDLKVFELPSYMFYLISYISVGQDFFSMIIALEHLLHLSRFNRVDLKCHHH